VTARRAALGLGAPALAVLAALAIGGALLAAAGSGPIAGYDALVSGALGSRYGIAETLVRALPLAVIALGAAPALRAGVFSVGAEGQLVVGAIAAAALMGPVGDATPVVALLVPALAGALAGAVWVVLPAVLKVRAQVNEILSTLLLNYVAIGVLTWSLRTWLAGDSTDATLQSDPLPPHAMIPNLLEGTRLHWGIVVAPILAAAVAWWLRTPRGLAHDVLGANPGLARRIGLPPGRAVVRMMAVGGATAGLTGWLKLAGVDGTLYPSVAAGLGFSGILVALLGGLRPLGIIAAALVFGALGAGADGLQIDTAVPASLATVLQGLLLLFVAVGARGRVWRRAAA
jgi:general nucleoside transport system permease protein